jgi:hypothetical protein
MRTFGLAAAAVIGGVGYRLVVGGELTLDTGLGRRIRPLGPLTFTIAAPRDRLAEARRGGHVEVTGEAQLHDRAAPADRQVERAGRPPGGSGGAVPAGVGALIALNGADGRRAVRERQRHQIVSPVSSSTADRAVSMTMAKPMLDADTEPLVAGER